MKRKKRAMRGVKRSYPLRPRVNYQGRLRGRHRNPSKGRYYPLLPSKKERERYFARFLDIFKKLEITIPFGEALQQMFMYTKFLKDLLTKKGKYINNKSIMVDGICGVVI